jgi:hypothetical protein
MSGLLAPPLDAHRHSPDCIKDLPAYLFKWLAEVAVPCQLALLVLLPLKPAEEPRKQRLMIE